MCANIVVTTAAVHLCGLFPLVCGRLLTEDRHWSAAVSQEEIPA